MSSSTVSDYQLLKNMMEIPSVTPFGGMCLDLMENFLIPLGFSIHRFFSGPLGEEVENFFATRGFGAPHFCFAGHVDVVPVGDMSLWKSNPFSLHEEGGFFYGRGIADMKGANVAFLEALKKFLYHCADFHGQISLLITCDEEGSALYGMQALVQWLKEQNIKLSHCLLGEPTNFKAHGEMIKIGRRGSLTAEIVCLGEQGHVGYPHLADNPLPRLCKTLLALSEKQWDQGAPFFSASHLEVVNIRVNNEATNVIPSQGSFVFNIRYNTKFTEKKLKNAVLDILERCLNRDQYTIRFYSGASEAFLSQQDYFVPLVCKSIEEICHKRPEMSTEGGTSDARFIASLCPVVEYGLTNASIHKINESVRVSDYDQLILIYEKILRNYFFQAS